MTDLSQHELHRFAEPVEPDPKVVGFDEPVERVLMALGLRGYRPALLAGSRGSGRTAALRALRKGLAGGAAEAVGRRSLLRLDCGRLAGVGAPGLRGAADVAGRTELLAFDDFDQLLGIGTSTVNNDLIGAARAMLHDPALRIVGTIDKANLAAYEAREPELAEIVEVVDLPQLDEATLAQIAEDQAHELEKHHGVALAPPIIELASSPPAPGADLVHPGLLVSRLDAACVRARMRGEPLVEVADVDVTHTQPQAEVVDRDELAETLRERVSGQEEAIEVVSERLALTSRKLDLSAHRPDGVFLFVGPTGVGKTELALALAEARFGDEDRVIRLDMSEFSEEHNVSRMIGPPPGYIGSDEPGGWLTTRVKKQPRAVVLFDEIEKAHPQVWMTLLQILDAGRLTDGQGEIASFSDAIVILTSNIGTGQSASRPVGFVANEADAADASRERVIDAVEDTMPPELVNRLDQVVVFRALPPVVIESIATALIRKAVAALAGRGWALEVPDDVIAHIAHKGYDPAYGARHVKRAIEGELLSSLAELAPGGYRAAVEDDEVVWEPTGVVPEAAATEERDGRKDESEPAAGDGDGRPAVPGEAARTLKELSRESLPSGLRPVKLQASLRYGTGPESARTLVITRAEADPETAAEILVDAVSERIVPAEAVELLRDCASRPVLVEGLAATAGLDLRERLAAAGVEASLTAGGAASAASPG